MGWPTPILSGGGGGPQVGVTSPAVLGVPIKVDVTAGVLGIALFTVTIGSSPPIVGLTTGANVAVPGTPVSLQFSAGLYVLSSYQGFV